MSWLLNEKNVRFDKMKLIEKGDSTLSHLSLKLIAQSNTGIEVSGTL